MTFEEWFAELTEIAESKGFISAGVSDSWRDEYKAGLTPQEAWDGNWDLY